MKIEGSDKMQQWLSEVRVKLETKMSAEVDRVGDRIPYTTQDGMYKRDHAESIFDWTNGFWAGILWQMYHATGDARYRRVAEGVEEKLDAALTDAFSLHHDVGFIWLHSAVADFRVTGNQKSWSRGIHAANILAARYNPDGGFIRAWNGDCIGWVIIDCMMNIHLLFWASEQTGDPRFRQIAVHHADMAMEKIVRPDGSANHIVSLDPNTGEVLGYPSCQGYAPASAWSRGQAWGLYGFALTYRHTGDGKYLDTAKRISHYFLANVARTGNIPLADFRAPAEPVLVDTTAAMIAACGLLEIAGHVPELEKGLYFDGAADMLRATMDKYCDWDPSRDSILSHGTVAYHARPEEIHIPIIYGDYFMIEALNRLWGKELFLW